MGLKLTMKERVRIYVNGRDQTFSRWVNNTQPGDTVNHINQDPFNK